MYSSIFIHVKDFYSFIFLPRYFCAFYGRNSDVYRVTRVFRDPGPGGY